jgi:hypothetical protein
MNKFNEALTAIEKIDKIKDLLELVAHINIRIKHKGQELKENLHPDDKVIIYDGKEKHKGVILKVNNTKAVVDIHGVEYDIPLKFMEKVK